MTKTGFRPVKKRIAHFYPISSGNYTLDMCFVCSCVWSSTSSRRKSDGWGSSSIRGMCASNSWSWRLRTSRTPSLRAHFKACPAYDVTLTSSWEALLYKPHFQTAIPLLGSWLLSFNEFPILTCTGVTETSTLSFNQSVILSIPHKMHRFFVHVHTLRV